MLNAEEANNKVHDLMAMEKTKGWQYIKEDFWQYARVLQEEINQVGSNEMKYSEKDLKILEMKKILEIINYPAEYYEMLRKALEKQGNNDEDPYQTTQTTED